MSKKRRTTGGPRPKDKLRSPSDTLIQQGKIAFRRGDYDQAILRWQMARGHREIDAGQRNKVITALAEAYFRRGTQRLNQDQSAALDDFQEAFKLQPNEARYAYFTGLGWHRVQARATAIEHYRKALALDPTLTRAAYALALALAELGENPARDPAWEQLSETQRANLLRKPTETPLSQALAHLARGEWKQADPLLAASADSSALAAYYRGVRLGRAGDDETALVHWQRAYDLGLRTPHLLSNLTLAHTLRAEAALAAGKPDVARDHATKGLALDPANTRLGDIQAQIHIERGYQAAEQGQWKKARDEWLSAENATGVNARGLAVNIAIAHEKLEEWIDAAEAWREFARRRPRKAGGEGWLAPQQVARLWTRISGLYMKAGVPEEAITTLQTALKYQPEDIELGLSLVRCYINDDRTEAAHNQLDRMLKIQPDHVETLVLKAELTEVASPNRWYFYSDEPGTAEWRAVLDTGDEAYVSLAKQRLTDLYEAAVEDALDWGGVSQAKEKALAGLAVVPEAHFLRARYILMLLMDKLRSKKAQEKQEAEIHEQVALIDLTDERALHQLIDAWHLAERHEDARATLEQANAAHPLDANFYVGIGGCALHRDQLDIAEHYFNEAQRRVGDGDPLRLRAEIGLEYAERGHEDRAEQIWRDILNEDETHGYAHYCLWILHHKRHQQREAQKHRNKAQRWVARHNHAELKSAIEQTQASFDNPLAGLLGALPPGFDASRLPELLNMLDGVFGDDEDDLDEDDFDMPPFGRRR